MNQFPESARRRMQAQPAGEHPDADLLTAFVEQALAANERERVLAHLAFCAGCREVVSLALPEQREAEVVAPGASSWFRWPVLRWTAVAATVIVVGTAVSVLVRRNAPIEVSVPAPQAPAPPSTPQGYVTENARAQKQSAPKAPEKKAAPIAHFQSRVEPQAATGRAKMQAAPAVSTLRDKDDEAAVGPTVQAKAAEAQKTDTKTELSDAATAKNEVARKDAPVEPALKGAVVGGTAGRREGVIAADKVAAPATPPPAAEVQAEAVNTLRQAPAAGAMPTGGPMTMAKARRVVPALRWRVSTTGAVEGWGDGAKWEKVEIDPGVTFRAISSNGGDLWAGGTGGALFHSADAGRSWSRVKVGDDGMWVTDAITGVDFPNAQNGVVTTASGAVWTTQDSGRSWQRRQ